VVDLVGVPFGKSRLPSLPDVFAVKNNNESSPAVSIAPPTRKLACAPRSLPPARRKKVTNVEVF
jgi:hypothetical protein